MSSDKSARGGAGALTFLGWAVGTAIVTGFLAASNPRLKAKMEEFATAGFNTGAKILNNIAKTLDDAHARAASGAKGAKTQSWDAVKRNHDLL